MSHINYGFHFTKFKTFLLKQVNFIHTLNNYRSCSIVITIGPQENKIYAHIEAHYMIMQVHLTFFYASFFSFLYLTHLGITYRHP